MRKAVLFTAAAAVTALLPAASLGTPALPNLWNIAAGRGYFIPEESSIFTFQPLIMNDGSGEWWVYGEDDINFYFFEGGGGAPYSLISRREAETRPGFQSTDHATWRSGGKE